MREQQDYIQDIAEIRSMMERSTKFLSLSGWSGIMAGIYALAGAWSAYHFLGFNPDKIIYDAGEFGIMPQVLMLALLVLILALSTVIILSYKKGIRRGEKIWNGASKRMLVNLFVPLAAGGIFMLILLFNGFTGLLAPVSLLFYGLALYNAGEFTYGEVKILGIIQMSLGLLSAALIEYSLLFWAAGFGLMNIVYGILMHIRYEREKR